MTKATKEKHTWELRHSALYLMSHEILLQHFLLKRVCQHVALPAVAIGRCYRGRLHPVSRRALFGSHIFGLQLSNFAWGFELAAFASVACHLPVDHRPPRSMQFDEFNSGPTYSPAYKRTSRAPTCTAQTDMTDRINARRRESCCRCITKVDGAV